MSAEIERLRGRIEALELISVGVLTKIASEDADMRSGVAKMIESLWVTPVEGYLRPPSAASGTFSERLLGTSTRRAFNNPLSAFLLQESKTASLSEDGGVPVFFTDLLINARPASSGSIPAAVGYLLIAPSLPVAVFVSLAMIAVLHQTISELSAGAPLCAHCAPFSN